MGNPLNEAMLQSFFEERELIEKQAGIQNVLNIASKVKNVARLGLGGLGGQQMQWGEAARRVIHPIEGLRKGWAGMAPLKGMQREFRVAQEAAKRSGKPLDKVVNPVEKLKEVSEAQKNVPWYSIGGKGKPGRLLSPERGHLLEPNVPLSQISQGSGPGALGRIRAAGGVAKEVASRASRSGWTGQGKLTKYMPVGGKGFTALYGASSVPGVVQAAKGGPVGPTGEGGGYEKGLGLAGSLAGWTAGAGLGFAPMMALGMGAEYAGGKFGRILDRLRSGANLRTAVSAPSPTQARKQMSEIQHYYGQPQPVQPVR